MATDLPIGDDEADGLLCPAFAGFETVLLAVSGGADSMALLHLTARWRARLGPGAPAVSVATVNHGLRPEAAGEAAWVAAQANALGLDHRILVWDGPKPGTGLQEAARAARYRLLAEHLVASAPGPGAVAVAHHLDDQAETLLMRLARGSGVDGLSGMRARRELSSAPRVDLVRPLLALPKARLVATLRASDVGWLDDPSNELERFERVRLRRAGPALAAAGLGNDKLALSATRLARARAALEQATDTLETAAVDDHGGCHADIMRAALAGAPEEIVLRLLARVLTNMGGQQTAPRLSRLEALAARLTDGAVLAGATLGGCHVEASAHQIRVFREPGRRGLPVCTLEPGARLLWDGRFIVSGTAAGDAPVVVRALSPAELADVRRTGGASPTIPRRAALTLPSVWDGDRLLAVPHLGLSAGGPSFEARFVPRRLPAPP